MSVEATDPTLTDEVDSPASESPAKEQAAKSNGKSLWVIGARVAGVLFTVLTHALLARLMTKADYGDYLLLLSAITFLGLVARFGLDRTLVRYVSEGFAIGDRERVRLAIRIGARALFGSLIGCSLLIPPLLVLVGWWNEKFAVIANPAGIAVILLAIIFASLMQYVAEVFRGMHDHKNAAIFDSFGLRPLSSGIYVAFLAIAAVIVYQAYGYQEGKSLLRATPAMALQVAVFIGLAVWGVVELRRAMPQVDRLMPTPTPHAAIPLTTAVFFSTCVPLLLADVVGFVANQGDVWIIGGSLSREDVALYGAARRFVQMVSLPLAAVHLIVVPIIPRLYMLGKKAELQQVLQRNATVASVPTLLVLAAAVIAPGPLLTLMFGAKYAGAAPCLVILSFGQAATMLSGNCGIVLSLTGRERLMLLCLTVAAVLLLTFGPWVARHYGLNGFAAYVTAILLGENLVIWLLARYVAGIWTHARPMNFIPAIRSVLKQRQAS